MPISTQIMTAVQEASVNLFNLRPIHTDMRSESKPEEEEEDEESAKRVLYNNAFEYRARERDLNRFDWFSRP